MGLLIQLRGLVQALDSMHNTRKARSRAGSQHRKSIDEPQHNSNSFRPSDDGPEVEIIVSEANEEQKKGPPLAIPGITV